MSTLTMAARTATGAGRASNQDAIITGDRIAGVADGMGGGPGGDVAATLAAVILRAGFVDGGPGELAAVTRSANAAIFERASAEPRLRGMGTTVCCVGLLDGGGLSLVSVGDSRAYVLRDGELRRLTEDHTIVAELVRRGELDPSLADRHPHRHVLTRVLGVGPVVEAESATIDVGDADLLLLCTDGLSGRLSDVEIGSLLTAGGTLSEVADRLVDRAVAVGADDDVTVVVVRVCRSGA